MAKRKRSSVSATVDSVPVSQRATRRTSSIRTPQNGSVKLDTNPKTQGYVEDGTVATEVEVGAATKKRRTVFSATADPEIGRTEVNGHAQESARPQVSLQKASKQEDGMYDGDPEADGDQSADPEELREALSRPPPVNSSYLPLPWKGRLGYACLNTYLRSSNPPVFSSRTCRIASILEHRHPLLDPSQPEHPTKNRPDKTQPADIARGQAYVEALGVANAGDIVKMLRWNDRYGIKFLRLSSEMFPFASHEVYGYKLAPFASEALAEAGRMAAELGHRLTTHPGQFTQLGSPRKEVISASIRDLEYHCELLDLLKLPEQQNRDAVMILHMGGVFGDKGATIARFKENYVKLSQGIKSRMVLENDDVCYSVHDLLPVCEELNIPLVLDYHHHNIIFDAEKIREGTLDIMALYDRIRATWTRKGITQKMHYSEPTPAAITGRQRRKHNPRVATLPPCPQDMDLMIEAKDKEQAVFELMRTFKLPGFDTFSDVIPYVRSDENKTWKPPKKKGGTPKKKNSQANGDVEFGDGHDAESAELQPPPPIPESEVGMGGPQGRVYWPPGMEEWLRPKKREVKPRDPEKAKTTAERAALRRAEKAAWQAEQEARGNSSEGVSEIAGGAGISLNGEANQSARAKKASTAPAKEPKKVLPQQSTRARGPTTKKGTRITKRAASTSDLASEDEGTEEQDLSMSDLTDAEENIAPSAAAPAPVARTTKRAAPTRTASGRRAKMKAVNYAVDREEDDDDDV